VYGPLEEGGLLPREHGRIIGITDSGRQDVDLSPGEDAGGAVPDALFRDRSSGRTLLIEAKRWDALDSAQLRRHFVRFFDPSESLKDTFTQVSWTDLTDTLESIALHSDNAKERFIIGQFIDYLDLENQVRFRRRLVRDFERSNRHKLESLLQMLSRDWAGEFRIKPYDWGSRRLYLADFRHDNMYFEILRDQLLVYLVCGAASRDHDIQLRDAIGANREGFRMLLRSLESAVGKRISVTFDLNARFFTILPAEFIYGIREFPPFPDGLDEFVDAFTDRARNTGEYLTREDVQRLFAREIEAQGLGDFPKKVRPRRPEYLQSLYF